MPVRRAHRPICDCGEPTHSPRAYWCLGCLEKHRKEAVRRRSIRRYYKHHAQMLERGRDYYRRNKAKNIAKTTGWRKAKREHYNTLCAKYRWERRVRAMFGGEMPTDPMVLEMLKALRQFRSRGPFPQRREGHCVQGHEMTPENIYNWRGQRRCQTCRRESDRRTHARKRELRQLAAREALLQ